MGQADLKPAGVNGSGGQGRALRSVIHAGSVQAPEPETVATCLPGTPARPRCPADCRLGFGLPLAPTRFVLVTGRLFLSRCFWPPAPRVQGPRGQPLSSERARGHSAGPSAGLSGWGCPGCRPSCHTRVCAEAWRRGWGRGKTGGGETGQEDQPEAPLSDSASLWPLTPLLVCIPLVGRSPVTHGSQVECMGSSLLLVRCPLSWGSPSRWGGSEGQKHLHVQSAPSS